VEYLIDGVILAGGQSLRMGRDKAGLRVAGKTLLQHQSEMMCPQVLQLFIAGNVAGAGVSMPGVIVLEDFFKNSAGPLSGALAALNASSASFMWIMPCDSFGFNGSLKEQLLRALQESGADIAYVKCGNNVHPLLAVWRTGVKDKLLTYFQSGERSVLKWYASMPVFAVEYTMAKGQCCNMNTPEDYQALLDNLC
jgi:molybdenum cofactor guanylyltransferase